MLFVIVELAASTGARRRVGTLHRCFCGESTWLLFITPEFGVSQNSVVLKNLNTTDPTLYPRRKKSPRGLRR